MLFSSDITELPHTDQGSAWSLDCLPIEVFERWEAEAIRKHEQAKAKLKVGSTSTTPTTGLPASKNDNEASSSNNSDHECRAYSSDERDTNQRITRG